MCPGSIQFSSFSLHLATMGVYKTDAGLPEDCLGTDERLCRETLKRVKTLKTLKR